MLEWTVGVGGGGGGARRRLLEEAVKMSKRPLISCASLHFREQVTDQNELN